MNSLVARIDRNHLEMLFYFALKKTGERSEAEELTQEIACEALSALGKGFVPTDLDRWLWGVARKRYARWAERRRVRRERLESTCISAYADTLPGPGDSLEEELIRQEQMGLLRRELALLIREYREIVVAHYFQGKRVPDIAAATGLPEGTVKRKLFETRQRLREGMQMARANGQRSYAPENVAFTKSGPDGRDGSPWSLIRRSIPKNILLEAYNNPCTIEDLSLALGIAAPYMEEEVGLLEQGTLLRRLTDGRFETDFIIIDREMQTDNFRALVEVSQTFCPLMLESLEKAVDSIRSIGFLRCDLPEQDLLWLLLPMAVDNIVGKVNGEKDVPRTYTPRPHGGSWDIVGYETCDLPLRAFTGHNGNGDKGAMFWAYKLPLDALWDRAGEIGSRDVLLLADIIRTGRTTGSLSGPESEAIATLARRGFVSYRGEALETTFPVLNQSQKREKERLDALLAAATAGPAVKLAGDLFDRYMERMRRGVPARLERQLRFVAAELLYQLRMMLLRYALEQGRIRIPDNVEKSTIAMYMEI